MPYLRHNMGTATVVELDVKARTRRVATHEDRESREDRSSAYTGEDPLTWLEFIAVLFVYACSAVVGLGVVWVLIRAAVQWIR